MTAADHSPVHSVCGIDWDQCLVVNQSWLRRVIFARTGELQAVEEVWQQVALAAVQQRWPLTDPEKVAPWLHRLAVIAAARYCRAAGRLRRVTRRLAAESPPTGGCAAQADPLVLLMRRERVALTRLALIRLAPREAEILLLKYAERWSYRQIAAHLGISEKAVDSRLLRAREALRRELAAVGIDEDES